MLNYFLRPTAQKSVVAPPGGAKFYLHCFAFSVFKSSTKTYKMSEEMCSVARLLNLSDCKSKKGECWSVLPRLKTFQNCRSLNEIFYYCVVGWTLKVFRLLKKARFIQTAIPNIEFIFVSAAKIEELSKKLERRFKRAIAITGTRSFHSFITTTRPGELIASTLPDPRSKLPILTFEVVPPLPDRNSRPDREPKTYQWDVWDRLEYNTSKSRPF